MDDTAKIVKKEKKKPNWVARVFIFLAFILGITLLTSCTKAFMSNSDKANTMYVNLYGQDSSLDNRTGDQEKQNKKLTDRQTCKKSGDNTTNGIYDTLSSNYLLPTSIWEDYISVQYTYDLKVEKVEGSAHDYKVTGTITPVNTNSVAVQWIDKNFFNATIDDTLKSKFGQVIVSTIREEEPITVNPSELSDKVTTEEDLAINMYWDYFQSVKAQALFGGFDEENKPVLWKNFDEYYLQAQSDEKTFGETKEERYQNLPTLSFVNGLKTQLNTSANNNRSGLNTSGVGAMYGQSGKKTYMEAKTWGEAFPQYGFLNGLFVWPFGWLINTFAKSFAGAGEWAGFLAIMIFTVIIRSVFIILSIFTNKSQLKMTELQPQINAIQARYPNYATNKEERVAMSREVSALYKKNKVNRWMPFITLIIQFPIFICVWSALQGAAELYSVNFYGLEFTTTMSSYIMGSTGTGLARGLAIWFFILMSIAQILTMGLPQWFNSWKTRRFSPAKSVPDAPQGTASKVGKYMIYFMGIFIVISGFSLPSGMSFYWFFGAIMSLVQTMITETISTVRRHNKNKDGDILSSMRRSKHHSESSLRSAKR